MARQGKRLTRRLAGAALASMLAVALVATAGIAAITGNSEEALRAQVIELNGARAEITEDAGAHDDSLQVADAALARAQGALRAAAESRHGAASGAVALTALIAAAAIASMAAYLYRAVTRPFMRLEEFAEEVAAGNLDAPLTYERSNPFGKFTWAFDHLRTELGRARKSEEDARENHKTALASLSHDLRTPLASLRAYAEALEMGLVASDAERAEYERAIMRKCDEVSTLVEDLFQHALSDMERITVTCELVQAGPIVRRCASDSCALAPITCKRVDDARVEADAARLGQVIDNLIGNAIKYAHGSAIEIQGRAEEGRYVIAVRDFGPGIPAQDMPFATERFYRGSNAGGRPGSGLGLFISAYLMERMGGRLRLENARPGLMATLELPLLD